MTISLMLKEQTMRKTASSNGVDIKAYAGTTGVLIAMNVSDARRQGLLGFAIQRISLSNNKKEWLTSQLHFAFLKTGLEAPRAQKKNSRRIPVLPDNIYDAIDKFATSKYAQKLLG